MKAAYFDQQGPAAAVLKVGDIADPAPGPGEVGVRVEVSGVNPTDIKTRTGFAGAPMKFDRIVPHQDGAGVIDQVGPGVPEKRLGERVWLYEAQTGRAFGTCAERVVVPSANAVALPAGVTFDVGACLGIPAMTAHRCLFADGDLRGKKVLVQGGAGAVGLAAILLAKWAGAWVATTVSRPAQAELASAAGADLVINRREQDVAQVVKDALGGALIDRIVEVDLISNAPTDFACLSPSGVISAYATDDPSAELRLPFLRTMFGGYVIRFVFVYSMPEDAKLHAIRDINACLATGNYVPAISKRFYLADVAAAHQALENGDAPGKVLVYPSS